MFDLFVGIKNRPWSIVPTVLVDLFVACTNCQKGAKFFHGPNLILHIWVMKHFKRKLPILDSLPLVGYNWLATHHKRIDKNDLPRNASEYVGFLKMLSDQEIR